MRINETHGKIKLPEGISRKNLKTLGSKPIILDRNLFISYWIFIRT